MVFVFNNNILIKISSKLLLGTAVNDPLGGCRVTPYGYSVMLKKVSIEFDLFSTFMLFSS